MLFFSVFLLSADSYSGVLYIEFLNRFDPSKSGDLACYVFKVT